MIISAHQPAYNPWLGFIHKILICDIFVVMDDVQYEKNSYINRNKIILNNKELMLTIPVKSKNYKLKRLNEIEVLDNKWKVNHLKTIEQSYKKTQNFDIIYEKLKKIYEIESNLLVDYTNAYLAFIVNYLEVDTKIVYASDLDIKSKKLDYVCELTKKLGGTTFVFGAQGKNYSDSRYLNTHNIIPYFQNYIHPEYSQLSGDFHPNMGIIDLLFNENKSLIKSIILKNNIKKIELGT